MLCCCFFAEVQVRLSPVSGHVPYSQNQNDMCQYVDIYKFKSWTKMHNLLPPPQPYRLPPAPPPPQPYRFPPATPPTLPITSRHHPRPVTSHHHPALPAMYCHKLRKHPPTQKFLKKLHPLICPPSFNLFRLLTNNSAWVPRGNRLLSLCILLSNTVNITFTAQSGPQACHPNGLPVMRWTPGI